MRTITPARLLLTLITIGACLSFAGRAALAQDADRSDPALRTQPGMTPTKNLLFNGWGLTPAGEQVSVSDLPLKMVISPDGMVLAAVHGGYGKNGLTLLDLSSKKTQFMSMAKAWNGLAFSKDGKRIFVSGGNSGEIHVFDYAHGIASGDKTYTPAKGAGFIAGFAVHPVTGKLYVCNEANSEVWVLNPDTLTIEATVPVGMHPHTCVFGADKRHLYVSNWGGRSVSVVDTKTNRRVRDIGVGIRPNDMALSPDGRLFVACAGDNTVRVIQTRAVEKDDALMTEAAPPSESTREILSTSLYPDSPEGSTPDAVAVSPDGKTLFVANADNNNVMLADISGSGNPGYSLVTGFIPTGWYPSALAVSPDGKILFVGNAKGGSRANFPRSDTPKGAEPKGWDYVARCFNPSVSMIAQPSSAQMAAYTEQVRRNCPYKPEYLRQAPIKSQSIIPDQVGEQCPIKYVLYIIKENRTYDQVLGDFKDASGKPAGNGDPRITMYGEAITPNQHQVARDYVLLDNIYCNGDVSADGHSWCDAALADDFNERSWMMSYSHRGGLPGNDDMSAPAAGYLWDQCRRHGVSYRTYGEGSGRVPSEDRGKWAGWGARDKDKVDSWIADLRAAEKTGVLPQFTIMSLPEDHTKGARPGACKPEACVASNDIGLGKIVAAASRSKFWNQMVIFTIEDDAQNGPDHVDAHRTVGLVISPWCKRGFIDSTLYTTSSMVRTMELILGLPPLTQYDAGATPMFNSFGKRCLSKPYDVLTPKVDLEAKNTVNTPGAKVSAKMDFSDFDRAPEDELNQVLWRLAKGPGVPYPAPIHRAVFTD